MDELDLNRFSVAELGRLYGQILAEMLDRGVIRTRNAPIGDYAEWLVAQATGGLLAPNSQESWDVKAANGERLQVKARLVWDPKDPGQRQLSVFRSWDFEAAIVVLFDEEFTVRRASKLEPEVLKEASVLGKRVNGYIVKATDPVLNQGIDWTERLRQQADSSP